MRPQEDIDAENRDIALLADMAKKGRAASDFAFAVTNARQACREAGLDATFDEDGAHFTPWQTAKAVRHAREDAGATLLMQLFVLKRLDRNHKLLWAIIILLAYIAVHVS